MHRGRYALAIMAFITCVLFATSMQAQQNKLWLGFRGGASLNSHYGNFNGLTGTARCGTFTNGDGTGFYLGHFVDWQWNDWFALHPTISYSTLHGALKAPDGFISALPPDYNTPVTIRTEHTLETKFSFLSLDLLGRFTPFPIPISLYGGVSFGAVFNKSYEQDEQIIDPPDVQFTLAKKSSGDIPRASVFRAAFTTGISIDIPLAPSLSIAPEALYHIPLTNVTVDRDWKISSLHLGIQLKFDISPAEKKETPIPVIDSLPPPPQPKPPMLAASILAKSKQEDGSISDVINITVEEIQATEMFPLLPYVFFGEGSAVLPASLQQLPPDAATQFIETNLPHETMAMYREILNIIGKRLQRYPESKITLTGFTGTTASESTPSLARDRAEAVKKYFATVWNISPTRITIAEGSTDLTSTTTERALLEEEARRVIITSDRYEIVAPIIITEIERKVNPPEVYFVPTVQAQAGLSSWNIDVMQARRSLKKYSGTSSIASDYEWKIDPTQLPASEEPVHVLFSVQDAAGQKRIAEGSIPVKQLTIQRKKEERIGNIKIDRYRLILFEYNSAALGSVNERILDFIKEQLAPNSRVTIDGYTDHVGMEDYNMLLSSERAKNVRIKLGNDIADERILLRANGESDLFDNATPEGRHYCRTVYVTVETPVE